jgi:hypothetical protein
MKIYAKLINTFFITLIFKGSFTVDLVEQCLLTNVYFDHLQALQSNVFIF